jgi:ketosteroid isomerase-like protein
MPMSQRETALSLRTSALIQQIYAADEALDAESFVALLTEDVQFRLGSNPLITGRASVFQMITTFFSTIQGLQHHLIKAWEDETTVIFEAEVTYTRKDGSQVTIPYVDVLELESTQVKDYKIYIDLTPLQHI